MFITEEVNRGKGGVTVVRECDSHQGGVKVLENSVSFMEKCNSYVGGVEGCGEV